MHALALLPDPGIREVPAHLVVLEDAGLLVMWSHAAQWPCISCLLHQNSVGSELPPHDKVGAVGPDIGADAVSVSPANCMARCVAIAPRPPCEYSVTNSRPLSLVAGAAAVGNALGGAACASIKSLDCWSAIRFEWFGSVELACPAQSRATTM